MALFTVLELLEQIILKALASALDGSNVLETGMAKMKGTGRV